MNAVTNAALTAEGILADEASSSWIRMALISALNRDPVDALNDALVLASALDARLRRELALDDVI